MSVYIVDDEQRRDRSQHPCALRVPALRGHLRCWRSSTTSMYIVEERQHATLQMPARRRAPSGCDPQQ
jgi:hypothetical protein